MRAKRPWTLRVLPERAALSVCARHFRARHRAWPQLYVGASLRYAEPVVMDLVPGDVISDFIAFTGIYEPELTRFILERAQRGGRFIDVGANLGYFTLLWAAIRKGNSVDAFEASPRNIALLRHNIAQNGFDSQVRMHAQAAGDERGVRSFDLGPPTETGWGGFAGANAAATSVPVEVVRIDEIVSGDESIALMKIDVEGAEAWVLKGCERLLRERRIAEIRLEQNKPRLRALGLGETDAMDYLASCGYRVSPIGEVGGAVCDWLARPA